MRIVHQLCAAVLLTTTSAVAAGQQSQTSEPKKSVPVIVVANSAAAAQQSASRQSKNDKVICKRTRVTGSLASTAKVCGTRHWWEQRARHSQEWTQEFQENSRRAPIVAPGT